MPKANENLHPLERCSGNDITRLVNNRVACLADLNHGLQDVEFTVHTWRKMGEAVERVGDSLRPMTKAQATVNLLCALGFELPESSPARQCYEYKKLKIKMNRLDTACRKSRNSYNRDSGYAKLHTHTHLHKPQRTTPSTDEVTMAEVHATSQTSSTVAETNAAEAWGSKGIRSKRVRAHWTIRAELQATNEKTEIATLEAGRLLEKSLQDTRDLCIDRVILARENHTLKNHLASTNALISNQVCCMAFLQI